MGSNYNWLSTCIVRMDGDTLYGAIHFHSGITMSAASTPLEKFHALAQQSLSSISKNIIVKRQDRYEVFGEFQIRNTQDGFIVYRKEKEVARFLNSRNALSYCIFEKYTKLQDAQLLQRLDHKLQSKLFDIAVAKNTLTNSKDQDKRFTALARVELYIDEAKIIKEQISEVVEKAKYFQQKEIDNEVN